MKLSITIIGHREADHLQELLPQLHWADEVVYVDCESADGSLEIATEQGCRSFSRPNNPNLNVSPINHGDGGIQIGTVGIAETNIDNSGCTSTGGTSSSSLDLKLDLPAEIFMGGLQNLRLMRTMDPVAQNLLYRAQPVRLQNLWSICIGQNGEFLC